MNRYKYSFFLTLDCLRPDHLGLFNYQRDTSPNIDQLAEDSIVYQYCLAPACFTVASQPAIFAAKYPTNYYFLFGGPPPIYLKENTFSPLTKLKESSIKSAGFSSNLVTSDRHFIGFSEYFDHLDDRLDEKAGSKKWFYRTGQATMNATLSWLEDNYKQDLFCWVHLMEGHGPYVLNQKSRFKDDDLCEDKELKRIIFNFSNECLPIDDAGIPFYQLQNVKYGPGEEIEDYERNTAYYISKYDTGISILDEQVGRLIKKLRQLGIYNQSQIIISSDHGEAMGENGVYFYHGLTTTPDQAFVPLIVKRPGSKPGKEKKLVSALDIMPTVLDFFEISPNDDLDGVSLFSQNQGQQGLYCIGPKNISWVYGHKFHFFHSGSLDEFDGDGKRIFKLNPKDTGIIDWDFQWKQLHYQQYRLSKKSFGYQKIPGSKPQINLVNKISEFVNQANMAAEDYHPAKYIRVETYDKLRQENKKLKREIAHKAKRIEELKKDRER